jgi:cellulose synthase/poly-beta-1,6-N-acetylglucosamine synthase-like glycosyltransferase
VVDSFNLYDLYILSFVQLCVCTAFAWSPARNLNTGFRWTGSRFTQVILDGLGAAAITVLSCFLAVVLWGLPEQGVGAAAYLLVIFGVVVIIARPDCGVVGNLFYAAYIAAGFTFLGYAALVAANSTRSVAEAVTATLLILLDLGAFLVWNSNINYASDVMSRTRRSRPLPAADPTYQPFVSLHIPAYNEPPELLIATIKAAEQIDYPKFEIIVIDNNTSDPDVYGPVEKYCKARRRVKFVHVAPWPGYKAGACNLALRRYTDPRAEIIGLIDADDIVKPYYLRETASYFCDERIGFVQTFEGNRDYEGSAYYTACVDSYQGFYLAVMSSRNERDSVPFVGTMGLFRRSALESVGGWNEWCISEDTEASLRVLKAGWSGLYIPRCFGRGIVPPTFGGLNTQRHRWCFGGMQILRLHWRSLMPWDRSPDNHLTIRQRRDYLMASLQWFKDLLMLSFALLLLVVTGLLLTEADYALMPLSGHSSFLPMSLILLATLSMTWTLLHWTSMSWFRAVKGLLMSLSASWITALACIQGLTHREGVFLRTSKKGTDRHPLRTAMRLSCVETLLAVALYASAGLLLTLSHPPFLLIIINLVQGTVYLCAPIAAFWNMRAQRVPAQEYRRRFEARQLQKERRRVPSFATLGFAGALLFAVLGGALVAIYAAPDRLVPVPAPTVAPAQQGGVERPRTDAVSQQEASATVVPTSRQ